MCYFKLFYLKSCDDTLRVQTYHKKLTVFLDRPENYIFEQSKCGRKMNMFSRQIEAIVHKYMINTYPCTLN